MAGEYSFRVKVGPGQPPAFAVTEVTGQPPEGVYQVSGHDNSVTDAIPDNQVSVSVVRLDPAGVSVVGATGYRDA